MDHMTDNEDDPIWNDILEANGQNSMNSCLSKISQFIIDNYPLCHFI